MATDTVVNPFVTTAAPVTNNGNNAPDSSSPMGNIMYAMMLFFVGMINTNSQVQVAGSQQQQVQADAQSIAANLLANLNTQIGDTTHAGAGTIGVIAGCVGLMLLGIIGAFFTGGATLIATAAGAAALGGLAMGVGLGTNNGMSNLEKAVGDTGPDQAGLAQVNILQQLYGSKTTLSNNQIQELMQIFEVQTGQSNSGYGQEFTQALSTLKIIQSAVAQH